jgi:hypothetical protein
MSAPISLVQYLDVSNSVNNIIVGSAVVVAVGMHTSIFWDTLPCSSVKLHGIFRKKKYFLQLQEQTVSQERSDHEVDRN